LCLIKHLFSLTILVNELNGSARKKNVTEDMTTTFTSGPTVHRIQMPALSDITTSYTDMASMLVLLLFLKRNYIYLLVSKYFGWCTCKELPGNVWFYISLIFCSW
jgi:hypothetical protein